MPKGATPPPPPGVNPSRPQAPGSHGRAQSGSGRPEAPDAAAPSAARTSTVAKVIIAICTGFVAIQIVAGTFVIGGLALGLARCSAAFSDAPIGDSEKTTAFIEDRKTNDYDLTTIDALRGVLDSLYESRLNQGEAPLGIDAIRDQVAAGSWPESLRGYGDAFGHTSPQLWVRLAELSGRWLTEETQDYWRVVDFSYPFPSSGPIPVPPRRDEYDSTETRLVCTDGPDKGLYVSVRYYRWVRPAYFESNLEEARERRSELGEKLSALRALEQLKERPFLLDGTYLYLWETGEDDPLHDPDAFCALVSAAAPLLGDYGNVTLLAHDTPPALRYNALDLSYSQQLDTAAPSLEEAQQTLLNGNYAWSFDNALGDVLYTIRISHDQAPSIDDLEGSLAGGYDIALREPVIAPEEAAHADEQLAQNVAQELGLSDTSQVIALVDDDRGSSRTRGNEIVVIVQQGTVPETPEEFCATVNALARVACKDRLEQGNQHAYCFFKFVVLPQEGGASDEGTPLSFSELRERAHDRPAGLGELEFTMALGVTVHASYWPDDDETSYLNCTPDDCGGSIARSREWRFGKSA